MQGIEQKLESVFGRIEQQRMRDVPVCNPALQVQAVGFREWDGHDLGVMLTPWFMNLMLLPRDPQALAGLAIGSKQLKCFPSGRYEFVIGEEAELGRYLVCSLFSPVFEFEDQETALAVASMSLDGLMDETNQDTVSTHQQEINRIWQGEPDATEPEVSPGQAAGTPMSRREFLRGRLRPNEGRDVGD